MKAFNKIITTIAFSIFGLSQIANGATEDRIRLDYNNKLIQGDNVQLDLIDKLARQHGLNILDYKINSVKLIAKSENGGGKAYVKFNELLTPKQIVAGSPNIFNNDNDSTFDKLSFNINSSDDAYRLKVFLTGKFKVSAVNLYVVKKIETFNIDMEGVQFQGFNSIKLKQQLKLAYGIDPLAYDILSVNLKAKSRNGNGFANLVINGVDSADVQIPGNPGDFRNFDPSTFTNLFIANPTASSAGAWKLDLDGNIRVLEIAVNLKKK